MPADFSFFRGEVQLSAQMITDFAGARASDTVLLAGSLADGVGNGLSDVDIYVASRERRSPTPSYVQNRNWVADVQGRQFKSTDSDMESRQILTQHDYLLAEGGREKAFECYFFTFADIERLADKIERKYAAITTSTKAIYDQGWMGWQERSAVSNLLIGLRIQSDTEFDELMARFPRDKFLYLLYRGAISQHPDFKDLCGWWQAGQFEWCAIKAKEYMLSQLAALLHLMGNTNHNPKWVWSKSAMLEKSNAKLLHRIRQCILGDLSSEQAQRHMIRESLELVDDIWVECHRYLDGNPVFLGVARSLELTEREFADRPYSTRQLGLEREHRLNVYRRATKRNVEFLDSY